MRFGILSPASSMSDTTSSHDSSDMEEYVDALDEEFRGSRDTRDREPTEDGDTMYGEERNGTVRASQTVTPLPRPTASPVPNLPPASTSLASLQSNSTSPSLSFTAPAVPAPISTQPHSLFGAFSIPEPPTPPVLPAFQLPTPPTPFHLFFPPISPMLDSLPIPNSYEATTAPSSTPPPRTSWEGTEAGPSHPTPG